MKIELSQTKRAKHLSKVFQKIFKKQIVLGTKANFKIINFDYRT